MGFLLGILAFHWFLLSDFFLQFYLRKVVYTALQGLNCPHFPLQYPSLNHLRPPSLQTFSSGLKGPEELELGLGLDL